MPPSDSLLRHSRAHLHETRTNRQNSVDTWQSIQNQSLALPPNDTSVDDSTHTSVHSQRSTTIPQAEDCSIAFSTIASDQIVPELPGFPASILNTPTDLDLLDIGLNIHEPSWLLGSNFDLNALDCSILTTISEWGQLGDNQASSQHATTTSTTGDLSTHTSGPTQPSVLGATVQNHWYTRLTPADTSESAASLPSDQDEVDEAYRSGLWHRLQPQISHTALPSADFLVSTSTNHPIVRACVTLREHG
jgi:hypothetical protein